MSSASRPQWTVGRLLFAETAAGCCQAGSVASVVRMVVLRPIHDRMPVIIAPEDYDRWLDKATAPADVRALLRQFPAEGMESFPVSTLVNNPRNESPSAWSLPHA
jgi:SOS response associated peptidase (SRAP)